MRPSSWATNTLPSGAKRMFEGAIRPVNGVSSTKPDGRSLAWRASAARLLFVNGSDLNTLSVLRNMSPAVAEPARTPAATTTARTDSTNRARSTRDMAAKVWTGRSGLKHDCTKVQGRSAAGPSPLDADD